MGRLQNVKSKLVNRAVHCETSFLVGFLFPSLKVIRQRDSLFRAGSL